MPDAKGVATPAKPTTTPHAAPTATTSPASAHAPQAAPAKEKRAPREENVVFIGSKPPMNYVLAIVAVLTTHPEVVVRARGNAISQAVTVSEIVRNKFVKDAKVKNVAIGTDRVTNEAGRSMNVSSIEIVLAK